MFANLTTCVAIVIAFINSICKSPFFYLRAPERGSCRQTPYKKKRKRKLRYVHVYNNYLSWLSNWRELWIYSFASQVHVDKIFLSVDPLIGVRGIRGLKVLFQLIFVFPLQMVFHTSLAPGVKVTVFTVYVLHSFAYGYRMIYVQQCSR